MFDIGWSEILVIAVVALIAIGPKELPGVLRMVGQWMGKARKMAAEFQGQFQEAMREAEMADLKKSFDEVREAASGLTSGGIMTSLQKDVTDSLRIDDIDKPAPAIEPPATPTEPAAPTPETFVEAETHAAGEPLAITPRGSAAGECGGLTDDELQGRQSVMSDADIEASKAPLMDHLIELRSRLIKALLGFGVAFIFCFFFAKQIYNMLVWPFVWVAGAENSKFIYTALLEYFITQLKLALFGAGFISFPIVATQIYKFVAPGLYKHERNAFRPYLVATPVFFVLGAMLVYFVVLPMLVAVLARHAADGRSRDRADRAVAEGRRISLADDVADLRLRHRLPASGDPDLAGADRHRHLEDAARKAPLFHRGRLHHRGRADAAGRVEPGLARDSPARAL